MGFREEQRFRQTWVWAVLLLAALPVIGALIYGMVTQLVLGQPWGDRPMSDPALTILGSVILVVLVAVIWLVYSLKLVTEVRSDGVHVRFFPLARRHVAFEDITSCRARQYRPIREYGGWGLRLGLGGRGTAWNVSGTWGVQLELAEGRPFLIGSQRAQELAEAINAYRR